MKGKGTTVLLIGLVAIVWGIIIYRVVAAYQDNDETPSYTHASSMSSQNKEPANDYSHVQDTTKLLLNYRDPFSIGTNAPTKDTAIVRSVPVRLPSAPTAKAKSGPATTNIQPIIDWNTIIYTGYIRNPATKKLLALMQVNGKELMMSEGETADQVRLLRNLRDSVKISYQGKTKFIRLNTSNL